MSVNPFYQFRHEVLEPGTSRVAPGKALALAIDIIRGHVDPTMNLARLHASATGPDYASAIQRASEMLGVPARAPTTSVEGRGMAMVVSNQTRDIVVVHAGLAITLFEDHESWRVAWHTVHHELAHIHDNEYKYPLAATAPRLQGDDAVTFPLADALWSEYHAERRSSGDLASGPEMQLELLRDLLQANTKSSAKLIMMASGYALGALAGESKSLEAFDPATAAVVRASPLGGVWDRMISELDKLYASLSRWAGIWELADLMDLVGAVQGALPPECA